MIAGEGGTGYKACNRLPPGLSVEGQLDPQAKDDHYQDQEFAMSHHRFLLSRTPTRPFLVGVLLLAR
jgi:hypothetical protein